jgi:hypothetical protein
LILLHQLAFSRSTPSYSCSRLRSGFTGSLHLAGKQSTSFFAHPDCSAISASATSGLFPTPDEPFHTHRTVASQRFSSIHFPDTTRFLWGRRGALLMPTLRARFSTEMIVSVAVVILGIVIVTIAHLQNLSTLAAVILVKYSVCVARRARRLYRLSRRLGISMATFYDLCEARCFGVFALSVEIRPSAAEGTCVSWAITISCAEILSR